MEYGGVQGASAKISTLNRLTMSGFRIGVLRRSEIDSKRVSATSDGSVSEGCERQRLAANCTENNDQPGRRLLREQQQERREGDEIDEGLLVEPAAAHHELVVKIAEMRDRSAET